VRALAAGGPVSLRYVSEVAAYRSVRRDPDDRGAAGRQMA